MKPLIVVLLLLLRFPDPMTQAAICPVFVAPVSAGTLNDPRWAGVSGMVASDLNPGAWWVHNDRGMGRAEVGKFYGITTSGALLREWSLAGVSDLEVQGQGIVDTEDIALGPGPGEGKYLYIGDIGGNRYEPFGRSSVRLFRLREPQLNVTSDTQPAAVITDFTTITLSYPQNERYDAETLMIDTNGDIYVVTKDGSSGVSHVFVVPSLPEGVNTATMSKVTTLRFGAGALADGGTATTSGAISPRGTEAVIRTYNRIWLWQKRSGMSWAETFASTTPCSLPSAQPRTYEAVSFDRDGVDVYDTYESDDGNATIQRYAREHRTPLPHRICVAAIFVYGAPLSK